MNPCEFKAALYIMSDCIKCYKHIIYLWDFMDPRFNKNNRNTATVVTELTNL